MGAALRLHVLHRVQAVVLLHDARPLVLLGWYIFNL
jgi:hypothetical protein